ncbi:anti-sigma factor family protein [Carbonactinospora thermoautotrophica]|uniref:anti-sigma factor family protein n=1 Tax=Carbonactinospora thermoautotrophica TaxID=1469144 RepID=UPI000A472F7C|nr:hypothetical protein [Carbonactinospora thermoautotrophica]
MSHLGDRVADLVDGELDHDARDRALAHLAGCALCRAEVEAARELKARLRALASPGLPAGLTDRLMGIGETGLPPVPKAPDNLPLLGFGGLPGNGGFPTEVLPIALIGGRSDAPCSGPAVPRRSRMRRFRLVTASALSLTAAALTTAFAVGEQTGGNPGTPVVPPVSQFTLDHARTAGQVPFLEPGMGAFQVSFQRPFPTPTYPGGAFAR